MNAAMAQMSLRAAANAKAASLAEFVQRLESPFVMADADRVRYVEREIERCRRELAEIEGCIGEKQP